MHPVRKLSFALCVASFVIGDGVAAADRSQGHAMGAIPSGSPAAWFGPNDYPADAVRAEREGRVVVIVGVSPSGGVASCTVDVSSGTAALDERTCDLAMSRGRFDPARDERGRPIAGTYRLPVKWTMPDPETRARMAKPPIELDKGAFERVAETETVIDNQGVVVSCRAISRADASDDPCKSTLPGSQTSTTFVQNGVPVGVTYRQRLSISVHPNKPVNRDAEQ